MRSYLVERYLPGLGLDALRAALRRAQRACAELTAAGAPVRYRGSMFLPDEEACFCRFEADSPEMVARANELADVPFARITLALALAPEPNHTKAGGGSDVHHP